MMGKQTALLVSAALMVMGLGAMTPTASAVSCFGDYCSGQDPAGSGCAADAQTIAFREDIVGARLELRWSRTCRSAWARWHQYPRGWNVGTVLIELRTVQDTGYSQHLSLDHGGPGDNATVWSPMIYSPVHRVRAEAIVSCGGMTLLDTAFDCAVNGKVATNMK